MDKSKWEYKKLGEVCKVINGLWTGKKPPFVNVGVIRNANFTKTCELDASNIAYIDVEKKQFDQRKLIKGDIIIEKSGGSDKQPVGRPVLFNLDGDFSFSNFTSALRIEDHHDIYSNYLYKYLKYVYFSGATKAMQSNTTGLHNLDFSKFKALLIPIAPLSDQQRIVAELDCLNEMIAVKQEQLMEFDKLAQSIFYDMFGNGYEKKLLGDFCEVGTGSTPSRKNEGLFYGGQIPWVKTTEVQNSDIYKTEETITDTAIEQTNCKLYPIGTILMAMYGQGKTRGQVARLMIKAATNQACAAIIPDDKVCDRDYLYEYLLLSYEKIRDMARGGNQANLNLQLVRSIPVPLPPLSLQQQFADKIQAIEAQKELVKKSIVETQHLLDSRMDYYFD